MSAIEQWDNRSFTGTSHTGAFYAGAVAKNSNWNKCVLEGAVFWRADLSGATMRNSWAKDVIFEEANLTGVDFTGSYLVGARFFGATGLVLPSGYALDAQGVAGRV